MINLNWIKWIFFISIVASWFALDQVTKIMIIEKLKLGQTQVVWEQVLNWTYVNNPGAAFGFLGQASHEFRSLFFIIVPLIVTSFVLVTVYQSSSKQTDLIFALGSVLGGALGNFVDRLRFGVVIDFIDIQIGNSWAWPAFNIADVAIVVGAALLVRRVWLEQKLEAEVS